MKKHKRMLSLLCAIVLAVTLMAPTALALQGPDVSVPDNYDLIYFVDCGAGAFPANIQTLLAEHTDTVENANTPDQAYDGTWGYTNATDDLEVRNSNSDDIYQSIRNFKSGKNGQTLEYKFAGDAGEYRVFVGLYDIWHDSNGGSRKAAVSVNDGAAQSLTYGSDAHLLSFDATVADGNGLSVKVVPTNTAAGDQGDVLVSFIMVTKKAQGPEEPQKPEAPTAGTSIWGKGGENWKLDIVSTCTNPDAAHVGGNTVTEHKNFISGKYFTNFGEMRLNNGVWEVSAEFDAMDYLNEKFGAPHSAQNVSLTLEYVNNKWCVKTDGEKAVINLVGACAVFGPEAPVLGENLEVWVQLYSGEYEPKRGSRIDGNTSTYGSSVTFGDVEKTGEQWTCDMTVVGYTKDSNLSDNCYLNRNMPEGYEVDPYELDRDGNAKKTVTLTYNQENGKWECPAIPLKHTSTGPASTSTVKYGVSFKIKNATEEEGAPALPVDNPVHNGGFWVSLYAKNAEGTAYEEVYTQVYDGTQDYVQFSAPAEGEGILGTYATTATVNGNDVLAASGLEGYELADSKPIKHNELVFDWDSMTWTAQTMIPYFDQPDSTIAKRGLAFKVRPVEDPAPPLPVPDETTLYFADGQWTSVTYTCTNENAVHKPANTKTRNLLSISKQYLKAVGDAQQDENGLWTCQVTLDAAAMLSGSSVFDMAHTGNDLVLTAVYNEEKSRWELPAEALDVTGTCTQNGPEAPNNKNCTDFYVTVYGHQPQVDDTVHNLILSSLRWDLCVDDLVSITFTQPVKNGDGVWTCEATVAAEAWVEDVYQDFLSGNYRRDNTDPTTKTITLTFDQGKGKWVAESDGVTYGYPSKPETRNGVAFRLVKQYTVTYAPGRDLAGRIPEGEKVDGGVYDKGATVNLPQTTSFVTENGVFAGWKVTIKKYINDPDSVTYYYPLGTETMPMFGKDVELEAYWMDVELDVADLPYDENKGVGDYTFVDAANFVIDGDTITVLYRAQVQGKSQYPYALTCDGAQAVYDSQLTGAIDKYQTSKYVYFTVTYTAEEFQDLTHQTVTLGNGASAAAFVTVTVEHQVEAVAGVAPTCTQDGSKAYWHCTGCGKYFADAACTQEITEDIDTWKVIPATGHAYGEPAFQWSADGKTCTVTFTCGNDETHVEVLDAEVTSNRKTAPTCTEKGVTVYTAKVTFEGKDYTATLELTDIPAAGHAYGEPTFQWSADGKTCTATFTCGNDASHVEVLNAQVTSAVKTAPTCTEKGVTAYTAKVTFQDQDYTNTLELTDIPAIGHAYGEPAFQWSADGKTCTVTFTCGNDETHVEVLDAEVTSNRKTAPTCTEKGVTVYTAKVTFEGKDYTATLELTDIPAAGHHYEDGVCTVCGEKDPDYVEPTEPTTEPTKPATDPDGPDQTGDTTPVALLMSLLLISAACLTAVIAKSRKIRF